MQKIKNDDDEEKIGEKGEKMYPHGRWHPPPGLRNIGGSSCFLNAILQVFPWITSSHHSLSLRSTKEPPLLNPIVGSHQFNFHVKPDGTSGIQLAVAVDVCTIEES